MSELQRSFARVQLAKLPSEAPLIFDERDEDGAIEEAEVMHSRSASDSSTSSTGTVVPSIEKSLFERPKSSKRAVSDISPLDWLDFFDSELSFEREIGPSKLCHHAYFSPPLPAGPLFVTHHGAGSSGLSFACFAVEVRKMVSSAGILSIDARGHGKSTVGNAVPDHENGSEAIDMSLETLSSDLAFVVQAAKARMSWPALPHIVLVGHSLGGAVVVDLANKALLDNAVLGYAVLDVVEGSAMESLAHMELYLSRRPVSFPSLASAIQWHTRSKTIRNPLSARISVPSLLKSIPSTQPSPTPCISSSSSSSSSSPASSSPSQASTTYTFLTPLLPTKPFWPTWFQDLSTKFLTTPRCAKLVILAGTDRLDKQLMIGQMQGKFQLEVLPEAGHFVHEDLPARVAGLVVEFWRRNERAGGGGDGLVLPPKVGTPGTEGWVKKRPISVAQSDGHWQVD